MRASGASELRKKLHLLILKLLFPSIFLLVYFRFFVSETYIFSGLQLHIHTYTINAVSFHYLWYGTIYKRQYADKTLTLGKSMYMRASLEKNCIFTFKNCSFFQYFVGTSETLSVQMTYFSAYMYRQISKCIDKTPKKH